MTEEQAEVVALQALGWLAGHDDLRGVFLGSSGLSGEDLRERAQDPEFLGFVLEFLSMDDAWITAFCDAHVLDYAMPAAARAALPGGVLPNWT